MNPGPRALERLPTVIFATGRSLQPTGPGRWRDGSWRPGSIAGTDTGSSVREHRRNSAARSAATPLAGNGLEHARAPLAGKVQGRSLHPRRPGPGGRKVAVYLHASLQDPASPAIAGLVRRDVRGRRVADDGPWRLSAADIVRGPRSGRAQRRHGPKSGWLPTPGRAPDTCRSRPAPFPRSCARPGARRGRN